MDLLSPEAKNPPKGPIVLANSEKSMKWACNSVMVSGPSDTRLNRWVWHEGREKGAREKAVAGHAIPSMLCRAEVS